MVQFHAELLNRNVAPGIAEFASADIPDLRPAFPQAEHWLSNHFLNTVLGPNYKGSFRQYAINMLARAQAQFASFHDARDATQCFLERSSLHNPAVGRYYTAIVLWESCFLNYQMFLDLFTKAVGKDAFALGDGSAEQRAYDIANAIKHWGGVVKGNRHRDEQTIPLWLSNDGFHTYQNSLTYADLAEITTQVAKAADDLQNPASADRAT